MSTNNSQSRREQYVEELAARFGVSTLVFDRAFSDVSTGILREMSSGERTIDVDTGGDMLTSDPTDPFGVHDPAAGVKVPRVNRQTEGALDDIPAPGETGRTNDEGGHDEVPAPGTDPREAGESSEPSGEAIGRHNRESREEEAPLDDIPVAGEVSHESNR
jgi:hypothetical protein